jgi:hypothetical protein
MKQSQYRFVSLASLALMVSVGFVACGGLDPRKVTRGPDNSRGGDEPNGGTDNTGGTESGGGEPNVNPFGGAFDLGGAPPIVDGPPEIVQVDPPDGDDGVEPNAKVSLLFNEAIDPETVSIESIKLLDGATAVDGDVTLSQSLIGAFEPARRLSLLASYDVSVATSVTDAGGTPLAAEFASSFTVRDGEWAEQESLVEDQTTWGSEQDLAVDGRGNVLAVWSRYADETFTHRTAVARWYRPSSGWQPEIVLEDSIHDVFSPRVAVSPDGDAVVAWVFRDQSDNHTVRARRYVAGTWEASAQNVAPLSTDIFNSSPEPLSVAIGGGQCVVAWFRMQYVPSPSGYYYNLSLAATSLDAGWPEYPTENFTALYNSPNYEYLSGLNARIDAKGNALATFYYSAASNDPSYGSGIYYTRKPAAGAWQYPAKIPGSLKADSGPFLAADGDGSMAIWSVRDEVTQEYTLLASRYTKAKQFVAGIPINDPELKEAVTLGPKSIAANSNSFFAAWTQQVGNSQNAYVSRFDIATNKWDVVPTPVSDGVATAGYTASVGVDDHGNALVAFEQEIAQYQLGVMSARYNASAGTWVTGAAPLSLDDESYGSPLLAVGGNGIAAVLFGVSGRQGSSRGGLYSIFE